MKIFKILSLIAASAMLGACATTEVSTEFAPGIKNGGKEPVAAVTAENYGYYLFGFLPIITGNPDKQNETSASMFEDTVTVENNHAMLAREVEKLGAESMGNLRDSTYWTGGFSLWIVWKQVLSSNALALKPAPEQSAAQ